MPICLFMPASQPNPSLSCQLMFRLKYDFEDGFFSVKVEREIFEGLSGQIERSVFRVFTKWTAMKIFDRLKNMSCTDFSQHGENHFGSRMSLFLFSAVFNSLLKFAKVFVISLRIRLPFSLNLFYPEGQRSGLSNQHRQIWLGIVSSLSLPSFTRWPCRWILSLSLSLSLSIYLSLSLTGYFILLLYAWVSGFLPVRLSFPSHLSHPGKNTETIERKKKNPVGLIRTRTSGVSHPARGEILLETQI